MRTLAITLTVSPDPSGNDSIDCNAGWLEPGKEPVPCSQLEQHLILHTLHKATILLEAQTRILPPSRITMAPPGLRLAPGHQ